MSDQTIQVLDEMQARCDVATEGPWAPWLDLDGAPHMNGMLMVGNADAVIPDGEAWIEGVDVNPVAHTHTPEDRAFIAASRTDMPRLIAALKAVSTEHAPESLDLLHPDCAEGACDHDPDDPERPSDCPVVKTTVCTGCLDLAERAWRFYGEEGVEAVEYPCPTVKAVEEALGVEV